MGDQEVLQALEDIPVETKRQVLQNRIDQYLSAAFNWYCEAEALKRQRVQHSKLKIHQRTIAEAQERVRQCLELVNITGEMLDELDPIPDGVEDEPITVDNMLEMVSIRELEERNKGHEPHG